MSDIIDTLCGNEFDAIHGECVWQSRLAGESGLRIPTIPWEMLLCYGRTVRPAAIQRFTQRFHLALSQ